MFHNSNKKCEIIICLSYEDKILKSKIYFISNKLVQQKNEIIIVVKMLRIVFLQIILEPYAFNFNFSLMHFLFDNSTYL